MTHECLFANFDDCMYMRVDVSLFTLNYISIKEVYLLVEYKGITMIFFGYMVFLGKLNFLLIDIL